jgi:hypothetical protein
VQFLIEVVNRPGDDHYLLRSYQNVCSKPIGASLISWQLDDPTGRALSSDQLPPNPPNLAAWQSAFGLTIAGSCEEAFFIRGVVQSISETPVTQPQPPVTEVAEAVEVKWQSQLGFYYQVQARDRHRNWTDVGEPVLGDGTILSQFFLRSRGERTDYQVEVLPFP